MLTRPFFFFNLTAPKFVRNLDALFPKIYLTACVAF